MKIQIACFLLVLLSATELTEAGSKITRHLFPFCEPLMKERNTQEAGKKCLSSATFVQSSAKTVNAVCEGADGEKRSSNMFNTVYCGLRLDSKFPKCHYVRITKESFISVRCQNNVALDIISVYR
ncbi:uncharacterized protein LOC121188132 [Scomber scombrus]|uniref:Uncharacterized protein LOC121188132 n=1 Tax=Scomber scombrus TaxID=13677 RepID=A0AAV1Q462_SCOSC